MTATATKRKPAAKRTTARKPKPTKKAPPIEKELGERYAAGLPVACIDPHPFNSRTEFDADELRRLCESLKNNGLLQPIVVRESAGGRYELIAGERRLRAAQEAGWTNVPAIVRCVSDAVALVLGLVENIERRDLSPIEKARGLERLTAPETLGGGGMTQEQAAEMFGHNHAWVTKLIALLKLPELWQRRIASGEIGAAHAAALVPYAKRPTVLARIEDDMLKNPWSWRTRDDYERNAKLLAETAESKPTMPRELPPMRAKPGTGERLHERQGPPAVCAKLEPKQSACYTASESSGESLPPAVVKFARPPAAQPNVVASILEALEQLTSEADLDAVEDAVEERRGRLVRKA